MLYIKTPLLTLLMTIAIGSTAQAQVKSHTPVGLETVQEVKLACHIKELKIRDDGISAGVSELRHLVSIYDAQGIEVGDRDIHGIFDDEGANFVLNNQAYARFNNGRDNPNASLIRELIDEGVEVEVCGQRLAREDLTQQDLLPGVKILLSGQSRVIDWLCLLPVLGRSPPFLHAPGGVRNVMTYLK